MVRFSDLLGDGDDSEKGDKPDAKPEGAAGDANAPGTEHWKAAPANSSTPEPAEAGARPEKPDDILDRLSSYATTARAAQDSAEAPTPPAPGSEPGAAPGPGIDLDALQPVDDDLLPRQASAPKRRGRR